MNVTIDNLTPCKKLVRFEVTTEEVETAFTEVTKEFCKHASLPGFRPGKAPKDMIIKQHTDEIEKEVKRKLIGDHYRQGIKDHKLNVLGYPDIEEVQFGRGQPLMFNATIETPPDFELPNYLGLRAQREKRTVSDEDITKALEALQDRMGTFENVERAIAQGDYAVVNYTGKCEDKPITELSPTARGLTEQKNFWVEVKPDSFIPGFATQLIDAVVGDKRTVKVDFPADFVTPQLAGKKGEYEVEVVEVKVRKLPPIDADFAKSYGAESIEKLREGIRQDLQNELNTKKKRDVRNQIIKALVDQAQFELPESMVQHETRNVVYDIVNENQRRGIDKEVLEKQKEQIYSVASQSARERVKVAFLFQKIADKEGIRAQPEEVNARVVMLAQAYKMAPNKFIKELEKRDGVPEIVQQIVHEKVVDFLEDNAKIEDVEAAPAAESAPAPAPDMAPAPDAPAPEPSAPEPPAEEKA